MSRLFVVGSFVVGLTIRAPRMPVLGENLVGDQFDLGPGGKGTNQAIAAARLGAEVGLLACIGDDLFANMALELYHHEKISLEHIHRIPGVNTGVGFVTLLPSGENWIVVELGANLHMQPTQVEAAEAQIACSDLVLCQFETPTVATARLGAWAQTWYPHTLEPGASQSGQSRPICTSRCFDAE
jgi:ribokinase